METIPFGDGIVSPPLTPRWVYVTYLEIVLTSWKIASAGVSKYETGLQLDLVLAFFGELMLFLLGGK